MHKHLQVWIDDLMLYATDVQRYLSKLERLFELLDFFGFKLSVTKASLYEPQVKWCGKIISGRGVSHDPERSKALARLPYPNNAGELQQFLCAANWMRESVIDFARDAKPLQEKLDEALATATRRTKRVASGIGLDLGSSGRHTFDELKTKLQNAATLAFPIQTPLFSDHRNLIYVFAPGKEVKKHIRGKLLRWAVKLMEYRYHIDHIEGASNVWADMISRWAGNHSDSVALKAMVFRKRGRREEERTQCSASNRLRGEEDRTPRTRRKRRRGEADRTPLTRREHNAPSDEPATAKRVTIRPFDDPSFTWSTLEEIISAQERYVHKVATDLVVKGQSGKGWYHKKRLWIPSQCNDLSQRLMVIAHCGAQGHHGRAAMMEQLQCQLHVDHLRSKVDRFLASCLLCMHIKGGKIVQRPWSETFRCHERNGALHWDFLIGGESFGDDKYLLVLKDHATHYCELVPCATPTSAVAVAAILDWHGRFGISLIWISTDQGTQFKNEVLSEVCKRLKSEQRFTVAYSPWINGSIE
ncbi:unnamed protein product [Phytophthora fragariaefolia]|uniref:Unnamed protein product n=1 Tax=Phytophthora fragariaefolia TaxID=1490495 RepID=A0A9W6Y2R5_9STRA|nr:unnamed protein product [Phytophthora fragariaefolia]